MDIYLDRVMNSGNFYSQYLPKILSFAKCETEDNLNIFLNNTIYISPSVLCDLLSLSFYIKEKIHGHIYFFFGNNTPLISFLNNTDFFLLADVGRTIQTDVIDYRGIDTKFSSSYNAQKRNHTDKIRRLLLPTECDYDYGPEHEILYYFPEEGVRRAKERISMTVQRDFFAFVSRKERSLEHLGIEFDTCTTLANAFAEIAKNAFFHAGQYSCFYTFQNYSKSGLSFTSSDVGMGYYESFVQKIECWKHPLSVFTEEDFIKAKDNKKSGSLMGIIEGILYRYYHPSFFERGVIDIIKIIMGVGRNNIPIIRIQSGHAMLQVDAVNLPLLFDGIDPEEKDNKVYYDITPREDKFRELVKNVVVQNAWRKSGHITFFDTSFPGVHISATIDPKN